MQTIINSPNAMVRFIKVRQFQITRSLILCILATVFLTTIAESTLFAKESDGPVSRGVDSQSGYIGALLGLNFPGPSASGASTSIGLTLGKQFYSLFGLGIFASYHGQQSAGSYLGLPNNTSLSVTVLTGQANLYLGGFHGGAEMGASIWSWSGISSTLTGGSSTTSLLLGLNAGYDHKFSRNFSIGAELHSFIPTEFSGRFFQLLAVGKIWL
jgi:hypothetical protein